VDSGNYKFNIPGYYVGGPNSKLAFYGPKFKP